MWEDEINQVVKARVNYHKIFYQKNEYFFLLQEEPISFIPPTPSLSMIVVQVDNIKINL